jgi:hypothetical protein
MTAMNRARRSFLWALSIAPLFAAGVRAGARLSQQQPQPQPYPPLPEPIPENPGLGIPKAQRPVVLSENQKEIRRDVERLFRLATQLRDEVQHTDSTKVLSLHLIDKAGEIEKLAKKIKDLARG